MATGADSWRLLPRGAEWHCYRLGHAAETVSSGPPELSLGVHGEHYFPMSLQRYPSSTPGQDSDWLAVTGTRATEPPPLELLSIAGDSDVHAIQEQLRRSMLWLDAGARLVQNVSVDLNGDGRLDHLLTVSGGTGEIKPPSEAAEDEGGGPVDLVVGAIRKADGTWSLTIITDEARRRLRAIIGPMGAEIVAVADIDGDGLSEVAVRLDAPDYAGFEVHSLTGTHFRLVLYRDDVGA